MVSGHAVLRNPVPYNTNPTTAGPCGVASVTDSMKSTPMATWQRGQLATITWNLVASDGGGQVFGEFDPLGGTSFTVKAWTDDFPTEGSNKFYNKTFAVPNDLDCSKSSSGFCTLRVRSQSNWYSCTTVKVCGAECNAPPPPPEECTKVTTPLTFCPNSAGVAVAKGLSYSDVDASLKSVYTANLANANVFAKGKSSKCESEYKSLLCGLSLPECNPTSGAITGAACKDQCKSAMKDCSLMDAHKYLYDCDSLPPCKAGAGGPKKGMSAGGAAALSIFLIALVATLGVAGYVYYKQGHLFGYAFDMPSKKVVKFQPNPHNYTAFVDTENL